MLTHLENCFGTNQRQRHQMLFSRVSGNSNTITSRKGKGILVWRIFFSLSRIGSVNSSTFIQLDSERHWYYDQRREPKSVGYLYLQIPCQCLERLRINVQKLAERNWRFGWRRVYLREECKNVPSTFRDLARMRIISQNIRHIAQPSSMEVSLR